MTSIDRLPTSHPVFGSLRHAIRCAAVLCIALLLTCPVAITTALASQDPVPADTYIPGPDDPAHEWIASLTAYEDPHSLAIDLTPGGLAYAGTCDGAADLATQVVSLYDDLPAATDSIGWARDRMTREIYGHGRAAAGDLPFPEAVERANPIAIVFTDYTDPLLAFTNTEAWTFQRGYATLYRLDCGT